MKIKQQMLVYVLLPIFAAFVMLRTLDYQENKAQAVVLAKEALQDKSRSYAGHVDTLLNNASMMANSTASFLSIHGDMSEQEMFELLRRNVAENPLIYGAAIAFEPGVFHGRKLFSPYAYRSNRGIRSIDIGRESYDYTEDKWEWYARPKKMRSAVWTEPYFDQGAGNIQMVTYSVPFYQQGKLTGITTVDLDLGRLNELADLPPDEHGQLFILSQGGSFVYHHDPAMLGKSLSAVGADFAPTMASRVSQALNNESAAVLELASTHGGSDWLANAPITSTGWHFLLLSNSVKALAPVEQKLKHSFTRALVTLTIALLALWYFINRILTPVVQLANAAKRASEGAPFSYQLPPANNEISQLAQNMADMATELQERESALLDLNESLESQIKQRTLELSGNVAQTGAILRTMADGVVHIDQQGHMISVNDAILDMFGYDSEELIGHNVSMLMPEPHRSQHDDYLSQHMNSRVGHIIGRRVKVEAVRRDGVIFPIDLAVNEMVDDSGSTYIGVIRDITQEKLAQQKLKSVIDTALDAVVQMNADGMIIGWNQQAEKIFGWPASAAMGQPLHELIIPHAHRTPHQQGLKHFLATGEGPVLGKRIEITSLHRNGQEFPIELAITPNRVGGIFEFSAFIRDISARKMSESALLQAREIAESANRAKSEFLANMSHEIRTPMNGVIGMVDVLLTTRLDARQSRMTETIRDSAYIQLGILNDILDFSKIEAGKMELYIDAFSVEQLVQNTCTQFDSQSTQKKVQLHWSVTPDVPKALLGDAMRLRQVLSNLITNAIKFSSGATRQGSITVEAAVVADKTAAGSTAPLWLELSVEDNGIGMDEPTVARLFQSFQQADASTTRLYGGTGLGLAISRQLIELMGGNINVASTLGHGSKFSLQLPLARCEDSALPEPAISHGKQLITGLATPKRDDAIKQGRLILVAEDNETNQDVIRAQLEMLGYAADIAADGQQALQRWLTGDYALLLSDLHMPQMDGYQLTTAIRLAEKESARRPTPIIALTANALSGEAEHCRKVGMNGYLSKPAQLGELARLLHDWLPSAVAEAAIPAQGLADENGTATLPIWDREALTRMVGPNPDMYRRLLEKFLHNAAAQVSAILLARTDADAVGRIAHALKSAARTVGAMQLGELCQLLETAGTAGDGPACSGFAQTLDGEFTAAAAAIKQALAAI